jgi:hypothetical protein
VRERLGLTRESSRPRPAPLKPIKDVEPEGDRSAAALALWKAGVDPRGTLAERYLASRSLELGDDIAGSVLRWHSGIGAMIALFRTAEFQSVTRRASFKSPRVLVMITDASRLALVHRSAHARAALSPAPFASLSAMMVRASIPVRMGNAADRARRCKRPCWP